MTEALKKAAINNAATSCDAALWVRYKATGDIRLRNELVMHHTNLVEMIARKMYRVFIGKAQLEDVISNGMIALIKAVESFDPSREIKFDTFASIRIKGSVIDYIRSQDWVPRTARDKAKVVEDTYTKLRESLVREPTLGEIAQDLSMKQEEVEAVLCDAHPFHMISLEEVITDRMESFDVEDVVNLPPHAIFLQKELRKVLGQAIDKLTEKERLVISLFYYEGLKVKEIAQVLEISSSRVCQIHSMALIKIKANINEYVNV